MLISSGGGVPYRVKRMYPDWVDGRHHVLRSPAVTGGQTLGTEGPGHNFPYSSKGAKNRPFKTHHLIGPALP